jgi:hypothetical protein
MFFEVLFEELIIIYTLSTIEALTTCSATQHIPSKVVL